MANILRPVVLIMASAAYLAAQTDPPGRIGRLNYMDGPVSFQPTGVDDWIDASLNRPLTTDDAIWVGDRGRAEFHVGSTALRLGPNTSFQFLNLDDRTVQIRLTEGTLTVRLRFLAPDQIFEIDTPNMAFTLLRPGEYRVEANPDAETTLVTVRDGEGEVTGEGQVFPIYSRQQVAVRGSYQITYNLASAPGPDSWDQWCSSRDRREDQSPSAQYVSREVSGYDDLDQYGRWGNQPGYGDVWMPTSVAADWAPYHDGHWAWVAPWGWTWVDDAPWGFAPYHYGRWASFNGRWGWIPGPRGVTPVYAPALVGWIGGGRGSGFNLSFSIGSAAAVGWFPLGPREPYFPSYQVSQGYFSRVNSTNTVINTTTINNYYNNSRNSNTPIANVRYANQNVRNAVTAVPQESFARGQQVRQEARPVPVAQLSSAQVYSAPAIAPQRESLLGARGNNAPRAPRPPVAVMNRGVVARTAPPPTAVTFERQQSALAQNPGRPLAPAAVQGIRQGAPAQAPPVRIVDMNRVKRERPVLGQNIPQPAITERQNGFPGRQQPPPQQAVQPPQQVAPPQPPPAPRGRREPEPQAAPQQPAPAVRQNIPQGRRQPEPQAAPPQAAPVERRNGPPERRQLEPQAAPPQPAPQAPPVVERQKGPPERRQIEPQPAPPQPAPPVVERQNAAPERRQAAPPPPERRQSEPQRQDKGKQDKSSKEDERQRKPDK